MSANCPNCGSAVPDEANYCEECGTAVSEENKKISLPSGMFRDGNGSIRWIYIQNMWKHTEILWTVLILFGIIFGIMFLIGTIHDIYETIRYGTVVTGKSILKGMSVFLAIYVFMSVISVISWVIMCKINKGRQYLIFTLTEKTVTYDLMPESQEIANVIGLTAMISDDAGTVAAGIAASNQTFVSNFERVKKVKAIPKHDLIRVNGMFVKNTIYCSSDQFEFVWNWITTRCPSAKIVR